MIDKTLIAQLGSPILRHRLEAAQSIIDDYDHLEHTMLVKVCRTPNPFLLASIIQLMAEFGHIGHIPALLDRWYTDAFSPLGPIPDIKENDMYWKRTGEPNKRLLQPGVRAFHASLRHYVVAKDGLEGFLAGVKKVGRALAERRKGIMEGWNTAEHSPQILFVRDSLTKDEGPTRTYFSSPLEAPDAPLLTKEELERAAQFAWESNRYMFGYFLPIRSHFLSFKWLLGSLTPLLYEVVSCMLV